MQTVTPYLLYEDVDAALDFPTFERARSAGAEIREEPTDQDYGERRFTARDPEGHHWFFATPTRQVAPEDWGAVTPA